MANVVIEIEKDLCKSCELCVHACPKGVLGIDATILNNKGYSPAVVVWPEKCIGCGNCALMCPDSVIRITRI